MAERYLRIAIQREEIGSKLAGVSQRLLQIGCEIPIPIPTGRRRLSKIEEPFRLMLGTEKNGGMARDVVEERYDLAITGWETVLDLPDDQRNEVTVVSHMGNLVAPCEYRIGVSGRAFGVETFEDFEELIKGGLPIPRRLEDLPRGTKIATKHVNLMGRIIRERGLRLEPVYYQTPESASDLDKNILYTADNFETGTTWHAHNYKEMEEILLRPHGVLIKARRLPWGMGQIFNNEFLPRVDMALENPERWLKPDMGEDLKFDEGKKKGGSWSDGFRRLISRSVTPEGAAAASALSASLLLALFTLPNPSGILNPWHSRISKEKD